MRWLADECVHAPVVGALRADGHDVVYTAELAQQTIDVLLADNALRMQRILLTEDKDFGEIVFRERRVTSGIILLRFQTEQRQLKWPQLRGAILQHGESLCRSFTVIDPSRVRIQPLVSDDKAS